MTHSPYMAEYHVLIVYNLSSFVKIYAVARSRNGAVCMTTVFHVSDFGFRSSKSMKAHVAIDGVSNMMNSFLR